MLEVPRCFSRIEWLNLADCPRAITPRGADLPLVVEHEPRFEVLRLADIDAT